MIILKVVEGHLEASVEGGVFETPSYGKYTLQFNSDKTRATLRASGSYLYFFQNYLVSDIVDGDNGNLPFDADTLRSYLLSNGFFSKGGGGSTSPPAGYGAGVKLSVDSTTEQTLANETKILSLSQPLPANPAYNCQVTGSADEVVEIFTEGYVNAAIEVHLERAGGFTQEVFFYIEMLLPAPNPQTWVTLPNSGRVFDFVSFTEGTKVFQFAGSVRAGTKFRIKAYSSDDVIFSNKPIPDTLLALVPAISLTVW